jgi:UDP-2,3-diacylglucosamine pyrophosphatase LpxH
LRIIAGDLFQDGIPISDEGLEVIKYLRKLGDRVIYVKGNHDRKGKKLFSKLLGVKTYKKYEWEMKVGGGIKKFCVMHGHQFDRFLFLYGQPLLDAITAALLSFVNWIDPGKTHVAKCLDWLHGKLVMHSVKKALRCAKRHGITLICGHTHRPIFLKPKNKKTGAVAAEYANCGELRDDVCPLVPVYHDGKVELHIVTEETKDGENVLVTRVQG